MEDKRGKVENPIVGRQPADKVDGCQVEIFAANLRNNLVSDTGQLSHSFSIGLKKVVGGLPTRSRGV